LILFLVVLAGFLVPESRVIPVEGATSNDWNKDSFWFEPWGASGVHKGVDIFGNKGQKVVATTNMIILYKGSFSIGGNVVIGLGPKWRLHYYAHLNDIDADLGLLVSAGGTVGSVGDSGNALGKPPHLHYSILSLVPMPWLVDFKESQGYKKAFYIDPGSYLSD